MRNVIVNGLKTAVATVAVTLISGGVYLYNNAELRADGDMKRNALKQEIKEDQKDLEIRVVRELDRLNRNIEDILKRGK